jgi:hypothetical protein
MDKSYADTVRLLLTVAPAVFANDIFAMKGGTAINLFVQDMPRLSVDIDVVYLPWQVPATTHCVRSTRNWPPFQRASRRSACRHALSAAGI